MSSQPLPMYNSEQNLNTPTFTDMTSLLTKILPDISLKYSFRMISIINEIAPIATTLERITRRIQAIYSCCSKTDPFLNKNHFVIFKTCLFNSMFLRSEILGKLFKCRQSFKLFIFQLFSIVIAKLSEPIVHNKLQI